MEQPVSRSGHCQKYLWRQCQHQPHKGHSRKVYIRSERYNAYQMPGLNYPSLHFSLPLGSSGNFKSHLLFLTHHCLPLCLLPTECDSSAYSGGFFALTNFLGQRFAERRTDVYVLTFTSPVDGRTGRMGETLCPVPPIFSFLQLCHPVVFEIDYLLSMCIFRALLGTSGHFICLSNMERNTDLIALCTEFTIRFPDFSSLRDCSRHL